MSSFSVAYSDSSIIPGDTQTSPRLNASEGAQDDSNINALGDEIFGGEFWAEAEAEAEAEATSAPRLNASEEGQDASNIDTLGEEIFGNEFWAEAEAEHNGAATSQHLGLVVTPHSNNEWVGNAERHTNDSTHSEKLHCELLGDDKEVDESITGNEPQASDHDTSATAEVQAKLCTSSQENNPAIPHQTEVTGGFQYMDADLDQDMNHFDDEWDAFAAGQDLQSFRASKQAVLLSTVPKVPDRNSLPSTSSERNDIVVEPPKVPPGENVTVGRDNTLARAENVASVNDGNENITLHSDLFSGCSGDTPAELTNGPARVDVPEDLDHTFAEAANVTSVNDGNENITLHSDLRGGYFDGAPAGSMNGPEEHSFNDMQVDSTNAEHRSNDMQVDLKNGPEQYGFNNTHVDSNNAPEGYGFANTHPASTNSFGKIGFNGTQAPVGFTNVTQAYKSNVDQMTPVTFGAGEGTGGLNPKNTMPKPGELDGTPFRPSMPSRSRRQIIDAFVQVYLSAWGQELTHIHSRLAECRRKLNVNIAPTTTTINASLPPVMGMTGGFGAAGLSTPARQPQPRPVYQMQPNGAGVQAAMYNNQSLSTQPLHPHVKPGHMRYGNDLSAHNGFTPGFVPSSRPTHGVMSVTEGHLRQAVGGMNAMNPPNLASNLGEFQQAGSSYVPGFNPSYQSQQRHAPAASNFNRTVSNNQSYIQGYSSKVETNQQFVNPNQTQIYRPSYGPPTTNVGNPIIQGSSQDGIQQSSLPITPIRSSANPLNYPTGNHAPVINNQPDPNFPSSPIPTYPTNNHKRQHSLEGWETGPSPTRRRVSLGNINSSSQPSAATMPSGYSSPPGTPTTIDPPGTNDEVVHMFFVPNPAEDGAHCTYQCPITGERCNKFLRGVDKRNRFRHLATHAQSEEERVANGCLEVEETLLFTRLRKKLVTCALSQCEFRKEVWRTDGVRKQHEKEAHPNVYEQRQLEKKRKDKIE